MAARAIVIRAGGLGRLPKAASRIARWLVVAALLASVTACGGAGSKSATSAASHASFDALVGAGTQLLAHGNAAAAAQLFQQAVAKQPHNPVGHYDLGVAHAKEGLRRQSLADYAGALNQDPKYVPAMYNLAISFIDRNPLVSIYYLRRVTQLRPDSPTAWLHLGLLSYRIPRCARLRSWRSNERSFSSRGSAGASLLSSWTKSRQPISPRPTGPRPPGER